MANENFTKGEWVYNGDNWVVGTQAGGTAEYVAECGETNGYLIAASPDLLEACRKLVDICRSSPSIPFMWLKDLESAEQAIEKATKENV